MSFESARDDILNSAAPVGTVDVSKAARPQTYEEYTAQQASLAEAREFGALPSAYVKTAAAARAALDARVNSKVFHDRLMRGEMQATNEWRTLHDVLDADPGNVKLEAVLSGNAELSVFEITSGDELTTSKMAEVVKGFREQGLSDDTIRQAVNGGTVTKAEHDATNLLKRKLMGDPEWGRKFTAGDFDANRQMTLINIILNCEVEGEKSKATF